MQACKTPDAPEAPAAWCAAASHALPRPTGSQQPTPQASSSPHHRRAVHTTATRATPYGTPRGASLRACESLGPCARSAYHTVASTLPCLCPHFLPPYLTLISPRPSIALPESQARHALPRRACHSAHPRARRPSPARQTLARQSVCLQSALGEHPPAPPRPLSTAPPRAAHAPATPVAPAGDRHAACVLRLTCPYPRPPRAVP